MFIPQTSHAAASALKFGGDSPSAYELSRHPKPLFPVKSISSTICRLFGRGLGAVSTTLDHTSSNLQKRAPSVNTTIGVAVGILLTVFLVGLFWFLYMYRGSIRITQKRHRRRKSSGSKNSKEGGSDPPPPPA
ncbi:uncharacterized protein GGS25DRAFT_518883 [Hypoxylon fragiforme]|uniref:uncharacterized protein n=1 Tax=Hypoxylon fragiforme TaxID=63214 RepID=UPI0020C5D0AA|nr:uncharacterized protein GGS25DRAFT_518883 [Hypoxylon fragiforme]KAI2613203.1 hypothetical protein GGS25DRAFT_518883 [Hypoxylon fragiforme]